MHKAFSAILGLIAPLSLAATISNATAAQPTKAAEDRYIAVRDAAIEKIDRKTYDKLGNLLPRRPDRRRRCFLRTQYALSRSTLALARIRRRASKADRLRMIFMAICGWSRR